MKKQPLTPKQKRVLDFLTAFVAERGYPPSFKEVRAALGIKSNGSVAQYLDALQRKGHIERGEGARQITLVA